MSGTVKWCLWMHEAMSALKWMARAFGELDALTLHDILRLRVDVFVVEQNCPYPELDGMDTEAVHITGHRRDGNLVAYARIQPPDDDGLPHVGRVVVRHAQRGQGLGLRLMLEALGTLDRLYGSKQSMVAAQAHLQRFYQQLGYVQKGGEYLLDGIPHIDMIRGDH